MQIFRNDVIEISDNMIFRSLNYDIIIKYQIRVSLIIYRQAVICEIRRFSPILSDKWYLDDCALPSLLFFVVRVFHKKCC